MTYNTMEDISVAFHSSTDDLLEKMRVIQSVLAVDLTNKQYKGIGKGIETISAYKNISMYPSSIWRIYKVFGQRDSADISIECRGPNTESLNEIFIQYGEQLKEIGTAAYKIQRENPQEDTGMKSIPLTDDEC